MHSSKLLRTVATAAVIVAGILDGGVATALPIPRTLPTPPPTCRFGIIVDSETRNGVLEQYAQAYVQYPPPTPAMYLPIRHFRNDYDTYEEMVAAPCGDIPGYKAANPTSFSCTMPPACMAVGNAQRIALPF